MTIRSGIAGRRRRRLPALFAGCAVLVALAPAGSSASSRAPVAVVKQSQALVTLLHWREVRSAPNASSAAVGRISPTTPITGERTTLPVLARRGLWLNVELPGRPNGHTGWILGTAMQRSVTDWHIVVDTSLRRVTVYRAGRLVRVLEAVVGKPSTPTPAGEFYVEESIALRQSDAGAPFALALSARSDVLQEFDGGPGQIALHGLGNVGGAPGTAVSHGCVRLDDEAIRWLVARVGPGVPVTITG